MRVKIALFLRNKLHLFGRFFFYSFAFVCAVGGKGVPSQILSLLRYMVGVAFRLEVTAL